MVAADPPVCGCVCGRLDGGSCQAAVAADLASLASSGPVGAAATVGIRRSARATRTCSRAVGSVIEHDQASQCANDFTSVQNRNAFVASNSPTNSSNVADACADNAAAAAIRPANPSAAVLAAAYACCSGVGPT